MGQLALPALIISTALQVGSMLQAASAQKKIARMNLAIGEAEGAKLEQEAGQSRAAAQRRAIAERENAALLIGRAQTLAGASGVGTADASLVNLIGDIGREGEIRAKTALYQGEDLATSQEYNAALRRAGAASSAYANRAEASRLQAGAASTLMQNAVYGYSLHKKYGANADGDSEESYG